MNQSNKDRTLLEKTISKLVSFEGDENAKWGASQFLPLPVKAPSREHLDLDPVAAGSNANTEVCRKSNTARSKDSAEPACPAAQPTDTPTSWARPVIMILIVSALFLAMFINAASDRPFLDNRWVRFKTYRQIIRNVAAARRQANEAAVMKVTGIAFTADNPSAVIGGQIVHEGDIVSDATVVSINTEGVTFQTGNRTWIQKVQ
ncbi:MAG: hypothetical protein JW720_12155 [Sedimentisphaerales bacterium]|nr:hypothetical protein [Sedimentisphaerales bacterium]